MTGNPETFLPQGEPPPAFARFGTPAKLGGSQANPQRFLRMKTLLAFLRFTAALAAFVCLITLAPAADAKKPAPKPADLHVVVDVPPTWRPFLEDDIAEALFYRLKEVFGRRGYQGEIVQLTSYDAETKDAPILRLNLTEWRIDRTGNAQCTMSATLKSADGEKNLGLASGTALFWPRGNRWGIHRQAETADALEDAADSAMRDLYAAVAKSGLVAGLEAKK